MTVFLSSGGEYVGGVKIYEVFYFIEAQVKTKKRNFPRSEIAKGQEEDGSQKVHG